MTSKSRSRLSVVATRQSRSGMTLGLASLLTVLVALALGCTRPPETREATADLTPRIEALEQQVEALARVDDKVILRVQDDMLRSVVPDQKPICKSARPNCPEQATWMLVGTLDAAWSVRIQEKATSPDKGCFTPPAGASFFELTEAVRQRPSGPPQCDEGAVWEYDVILMDGDQEVDRIDPLFFLPFI